jgi:hypothetical protein
VKICAALYGVREGYSFARLALFFHGITGKLRLTNFSTNLTRVDGKQSRPPLSRLMKYSDKVDPNSIASFSLESRSAVPDSESFEMGMNWLKMSAAFGVEEKMIQSNGMSIATLLSLLVAELRPKCGFATKIPSERSAIFTAGGIPYRIPLGTAEHVRHYDFQAASGGSGFDCSLLRDLYEWNILGRAQRSLLIASEPLERWIARVGVGELNWLNDELLLWTIDDSNRCEVRRILYESGAFVASV